MSAYSYCSEITLSGEGGEIGVVYEVRYSVSPGRAQTYWHPEEPAEVEVTRAILTGPDNKRLECPEWLHAILCPTDDVLLVDAGEREESAACDAAEARWELQREERWQGAAE